MKKLVALLVVMAIAAPSMAATTIGCAQVGTTAPYQFVITYAYDGTGSFPRAFALDVTTNLGTFTGATPAMSGESTSTTKGFGIFPGTIAIGTDGVVTNYGSPVAPQGDLPGDTKQGLTYNNMTLELGSLYVGTAAKPANSGTLATVAMDIPTTGTATISIVGNASRGKLVAEDASSTAVSTSCAVVKAPAGCTCKGNVNADASVNSADVVALVGKLNTYGGKTKTIPSSNTNFSLCGDANVDGSNTSADVVKIVGWLNTYGGKTKTVACPHTYN